METDGGDVVYFIHYPLQVIRRAIRDLHEYLASERRQIREAAQLLKGHPELNNRQAALVYEFLKNRDYPITIAQFAGQYRVTHQTARNDLLDLAEKSFVTKSKVKNKLVFWPAEHLKARVAKMQRKDE